MAANERVVADHWYDMDKAVSDHTSPDRSVLIYRCSNAFTSAQASLAIVDLSTVNGKNNATMKVSIRKPGEKLGSDFMVSVTKGKTTTIKLPGFWFEVDVSFKELSLLGSTASLHLEIVERDLRISK